MRLNDFDEVDPWVRARLPICRGRSPSGARRRHRLGRRTDDPGRFGRARRRRRRAALDSSVGHLDAARCPDATGRHPDHGGSHRPAGRCRRRRGQRRGRRPRPMSSRYPSHRRAPGPTRSSSTTSGTASRRRRAPASRSGSPPMAPLLDTPLYVGDELCIPEGATAPAPAPTTTAPPATTAATDLTATRHRRPPAPAATDPATTPPRRHATATHDTADDSARADTESGRGRGADPRDLARRPRGARPHDRQARERSPSVGQQLVLLRRLRHLLRDGQELARRSGRDLRRPALRRPDEHRRRVPPVHARRLGALVADRSGLSELTGAAIRVPFTRGLP